MKETQIDIRTPLQKEKAERNKKIYLEYNNILKNPPSGVTKWAIYRIIGEKYGLKTQGVRGIISKMENTIEK